VAGQATVVMHHNITYHVERPDATTEKVRSSRSVPNSVEATFDQELGYGQACMVRADPPPQIPVGSGLNASMSPPPCETLCFVGDRMVTKAEKTVHLDDSGGRLPATYCTQVAFDATSERWECDTNRSTTRQYHISAAKCDASGDEASKRRSIETWLHRLVAPYSATVGCPSDPPRTNCSKPPWNDAKLQKLDQPGFDIFGGSSTLHAAEIIPLTLHEMGYDINPVWPDCNPGLGLIRECNDLTAQDLVQQALNGTDGVDQDNDGLCTMSQFLTWARARPQWAKDQLTHCCSVGRTDPLYFTDPSSGTAPFFSAYEQPFLRQYYDHTYDLQESNGCQPCHTLAPIGDFKCECWRVDGWGWLPEEGNRLMTAFPGGSRTGVSESDTPWAGVKVRDPPPSQRIGKDTCSHVQDKCKTFCATTDAGCLEASKLKDPVAKLVSTSWLESPCLNDAQCSTKVGVPSVETVPECTCGDGYTGGDCNTCEGYFNIECENKYVVLSAVVGVLFVCSLLVIDTKRLMGNFMARVKRMTLAVRGICATLTSCCSRGKD